jgi:hypothetical protein
MISPLKESNCQTAARWQYRTSEQHIFKTDLSIMYSSIIMRILSIILTLGLLGSLSYAQRSEHPRPSAEQRQAMRQDIQAYLDANVLPVLAPARSAFDANLSAEEQRTLAATRSQLAARRQAKGQDRSERGDRPDRAARPSDADRAARHEAHRAEKQALMDPVADIAATHAVALRRTLQELRPQAETWRQDLHAIMAAYRPTTDAQGEQDRPARGDHQGRKGHDHDRGHSNGHGRGHLGAMDHWLRPVGFLLWTPEQALMPQAAATTNLSLYPNPASGQTTITFELDHASEVRFDLLDANGQVMQTLPVQSLSAGKHEQPLRLNDLQAGIYFVRLSVGKETSIQKLVVK